MQIYNILSLTQSCPIIPEWMFTMDGIAVKREVIAILLHWFGSDVVQREERHVSVCEILEGHHCRNR